jgi:hypothetical protein
VTPTFASLRFGEAGRWYFEPEDVKSLQHEANRFNQDVVYCLKSWADHIESDLCALAKAGDDAGLLSVNPPRVPLGNAGGEQS